MKSQPIKKSNYSNGLRVNTLLVVAAALFLVPESADSAVETLVVTLSSGSTSYSPPVGKVLVVEHVAFSDSWDSVTTPRQINWYPNTNSGGSYWRSAQIFSSSFNSLLRPVRLGSDSRVTIPSGLPAGHLCFLWGLLVDVQDLYAAQVPSRIDAVAASPGAGGTGVEAVVSVSSPRPVKVNMETSTDLVQWHPRSDATVASGSSKTEKQVEVQLTGPGAEQRGFVRADVRARHRELLAPRQRRVTMPSSAKGSR